MNSNNNNNMNTNNNNNISNSSSSSSNNSSNSDTIGIIVTTSALCAITAVAITSTIYAIYFNKEELIISTLFSFFSTSTSSNTRENHDQENNDTKTTTTTNDTATNNTSTNDSKNNESLSNNTNDDKNIKNNTNDNKNCTIIISLPQWLIEYQESLQDINYLSDEDMMTVAINISSQNIINNTGGPFGCAIFERKSIISTTNNETITVTTKLLSVGANLVVQSNNSTLHGEMVAIQFAQSKLNTYTLQKPNHDTINESESDNNNTTISYYYIVVTSCEPCCMCLGSILWSGIHELICGATKNNAESIGFQEGPVFNESYQQLITIGNILVKRNILQKEANTILQQYYNSDNIIYNGTNKYL